MSDDARATDLEVRVRFPFGRYAATPWFRSRREHVGNVEWPPSPWRFARALVAVAATTMTESDLEATHAIVTRLAEVEPEYSLPHGMPIVYTQWMPTLAYDDTPMATQRLDNGHTLLDVDPDADLALRWPGVSLRADETKLLDRLLARLPYLGQSVAVCEARRAGPNDAKPEPLAAWPAGRERARPATTDLVRLLTPAPSVTLEQLSVDTADGTLKSMPAPPGSRWLDYVVERPPSPREPLPEAHVRAVVYSLHGVRRPPVARPEDGERHDVPRQALGERLARALHLQDPPRDVEALDDDLDGRAERLRVVLATALPPRQLGGALDPRRPLRLTDRTSGVEVDCELLLEDVEWLEGAAPIDRREATLLDAPLCFRLRSANPPLLADAITVAEAFHRRLLGVARVRWGPHAIPARLSGRGPSGERLASQHHHAHVLAGARTGATVTHLMVWARGGFTHDESDAIRATTLPALAGKRIVLEETHEHPALGSARSWRTLLPFLPVRHPRRRGGRIVPSIEDQVRDELAARDLPKPERIRRLAGDWPYVRTVRTTRDRSHPALGAHGIQIEFAEPVAGPIALGANCHYSMGLFAPAEP